MLFKTKDHCQMFEVRLGAGDADGGLFSDIFPNCCGKFGVCVPKKGFGTELCAIKFEFCWNWFICGN